MKKIGEGAIPKEIPDYSSYYNYEWHTVGGKSYCYETGQMVEKKPKSADKLWRPCDDQE